MLSCYSAEQVDQAPYTTTRLYMPELVTGGATYQVQYGRRYTFAAAGQATSYLRLKRQVYSAASLDALVSNTGVASGNLNLCLDIGNDGTCDFSHNANTTFPATLTATTFANALNTYLLAQTAIPWGQPVDVPVRVQVDRAADVMLTNLALTPVGAKTRFLRLPARDVQQRLAGHPVRQRQHAGRPAGLHRGRRRGRHGGLLLQRDPGELSGGDHRRQRNGDERLQHLPGRPQR